MPLNPNGSNMQDKPTIIVDQRERNKELLSRLAQHAGIEMKTLEIGDYLISGKVCVERKTVHDLESSVISGRIFDQSERLKAAYEKPLVIVEGDISKIRLERKAVSGAILSLYIRYGIPFMFSRDAEETADLLYMLAKWEQTTEWPQVSPKRGRRARTNAQFQEYIIGNIPDIGPKIARSLLLRFGSIKAISEATVEELRCVDKIGPKKAEKIFEIMNSKYSEGSED